MVTYFLAHVVGWYLVIFSGLLLFRNEQMRHIMTEIVTSRGLFFVLAILTVIIGLLMVTSHNIWVMAWPVVITLFSWLVLISGLLRVFFPDTSLKMAQSFIAHPVRMNTAAVVFLLIGVYLLLHVFYW